MSEIYKNSSQTIHLDVIGGQADSDSVEATAYRGTVATPLTVTGPQTVNGYEQWSAIVSFGLTNNDGEVKVVWTFTIDNEPITKTDFLDVVTPYVNIKEAREELDIPSDVSDATIMRAERKARRIIDRFCGQSFGLITETRYIRGNGTSFVRLPGRLVSVDTATDSTSTTIPLTGYQVRNDGWSMKRVWDYAVDDSPYYTNPIHVPWGPAPLEFQRGYEWAIKGKWGWERVPPAVHDAALLIIEQELCPQAIYRERYVKTMTAADWRIEVDPMSWHGTGNAVADQILVDYIVDGISIL